MDIAYNLHVFFAGTVFDFTSLKMYQWRTEKVKQPVSLSGRGESYL